jgi:Ser/Thr protein kinase RdoA (MazF antagonist)
MHVGWEHDFLAALSASGFSAPQPQRLFAGRSWHCTQEGVWAALSYLPGESLSWRQSPGMFEAGAFLAQYHRTAAKVVMRDSGRWWSGSTSYTAWRHGRSFVAWPGKPATRGRWSGFRRWLRRLMPKLQADTAGASWDRLVVHGDFTNANILVSDDGRRISGVIDFGLSQLAPAAADVAAALWHSGRPDPVADELDRGGSVTSSVDTARCGLSALLHSGRCRSISSDAASSGSSAAPCARIRTATSHCRSSPG